MSSIPLGVVGSVLLSGWYQSLQVAGSQIRGKLTSALNTTTTVLELMPYWSPSLLLHWFSQFDRKNALVLCILWFINQPEQQQNRGKDTYMKLPFFTLGLLLGKASALCLCRHSSLWGTPSFLPFSHDSTKVASPKYVSSGLALGATPTLLDLTWRVFTSLPT